VQLRGDRDRGRDTRPAKVKLIALTAAALSALVGRVCLLLPHPVPSSPACRSTPQIRWYLVAAAAALPLKGAAIDSESLRMGAGDQAAGHVDDEPWVPGPAPPACGLFAQTHTRRPHPEKFWRGNCDTSRDSFSFQSVWFVPLG
jgi:hypothetical protein